MASNNEHTPFFSERKHLSIHLCKMYIFLQVSKTSAEAPMTCHTF